MINSMSGSLRSSAFERKRYMKAGGPKPWRRRVQKRLSPFRFFRAAADRFCIANRAGEDTALAERVRSEE